MGSTIKKCRASYYSCSCTIAKRPCDSIEYFCQTESSKLIVLYTSIIMLSSAANMSECLILWYRLPSTGTTLCPSRAPGHASREATTPPLT
jgi:hypothetical protein